MWPTRSRRPAFAAVMAAAVLVLDSGRGAAGFYIGTSRKTRSVLLWSTPEDKGSDPTYGQGPVTDEDEARLAELVKTRMDQCVVSVKDRISALIAAGLRPPSSLKNTRRK